MVDAPAGSSSRRCRVRAPSSRWMPTRRTASRAADRPGAARRCVARRARLPDVRRGARLRDLGTFLTMTAARARAAKISQPSQTLTPLTRRCTRPCGASATMPAIGQVSASAAASSPASLPRSGGIPRRAPSHRARDRRAAETARRILAADERGDVAVDHAAPRELERGRTRPRRAAWRPTTRRRS